jgi:hypothetical protein
MMPFHFVMRPPRNMREPSKASCQFVVDLLGDFAP